MKHVVEMHVKNAVTSPPKDPSGVNFEETILGCPEQKRNGVFSIPAHLHTSYDS